MSGLPQSGHGWAIYEYTPLVPHCGGGEKRLRRQNPKGVRMSLRAISAELAAQGFLNENGRPFAAASVKSMLA
jgi:hypothetical protein